MRPVRRQLLLPMVAALLACSADRATGPGEDAVTAVATADGMAIRNTASLPVCWFAISRNAVPYTDYVLGTCRPDYPSALQPGESRVVPWERLVAAPGDREYEFIWWTGDFDNGSDRVHMLTVMR